MEYIDTKKDKIEWWFKNGNYGQEYFAIKYWNSQEKAFRLFYPDWIIRFKDGRIGIFDTKAGDTALPNGKGNTKDKAKALSIRLKKIGKNFVGGIAVFGRSIITSNESWNKYDFISNFVHTALGIL